MSHMGTSGGRTVSVAIPVYNGEDYLAEALTSVASQTRPPDEILVFDNASTDRSRAIAAEHLPETSLRPSSANVGAVVNFNRAVRECTGEYFAWLAADDRLAPKFVELTSAALHASEASVCLPAIQYIDPKGEKLSIQTGHDLASPDVRKRLRSYLRRPRWTEVYGLYRRSSLLESPMFRDEFGADVLLTWWFLLREPLLVLDEPLVEYRRYPEKSADATVESLNPNALRRRWLMTSLWVNLWREAAGQGVERSVMRLARRELVRALFHRHWIHHIAWDLYLVAGDARRRFLVRTPR